MTCSSRRVGQIYFLGFIHIVYPKAEDIYNKNDIALLEMFADLYFQVFHNVLLVLSFADLSIILTPFNEI